LAPYLALLDITALTAGGLFRTVRRSAAPIEGQRRHAKAVALCAATAVAILPFQAANGFDSGKLGDVHVVNPQGELRGLVVLFSDQRGWTQKATEVAAAAANAGALVVGVDLPAYLRRLDQQRDEQCHRGINDIEWVSRQIQRGNASYHTPILAGLGEGGVLAEALLAQARPATVEGAATHRDALVFEPARQIEPRGWFFLWSVAVTSRVSCGAPLGRWRKQRAPL